MTNIYLIKMYDVESLEKQIASMGKYTLMKEYALVNNNMVNLHRLLDHEEITEQEYYQFLEPLDNALVLICEQLASYYVYEYGYRNKGAYCVKQRHGRKRGL